MNKNEFIKTTDTNEVLIQGVIVHKFATDDVAIITVNTGRATPVPNYPKILFFGEMLDKAKKYEVGDHVKITGNLQSSRRKENIKNQIMQSIFAESIEYTPSIMEDAYKDIAVPRSHKPSVNKFAISGKVVKAQNLNADIVRLTLRVKKGKHISFPKLVLYTRNAEKVIEEITDKYVYTIGCVQTSKKETKDRINHYENYVITEYTVANNE